MSFKIVVQIDSLSTPMMTNVVAEVTTMKGGEGGGLHVCGVSQLFGWNALLSTL